MIELGLLIIATNKYADFVEPLIKSADKFFFKNSPNINVNYFVFTNKSLDIQSNRNIFYIDVEHKSWPWMTLGRYQLFSKNESVLKGIQYLYYIDADMRFEGDVGVEILSDIVGTIHPGFLGGRGTPETNPKSLAYISPYTSMTYCAGGFNGGTSKEYLKMANKLSENIEEDYCNGIIAVWHDESHLNRYYIDNPPTTLLSPAYCYPESWDLPFARKIVALDKNHAEMRK